jgi:acyl carrier protein
MDVELKVKEIVSDSLGLTSEFSVHDKFIDLGADSLDTVELVIEVEESFGVELNDIETESCSTPQHLISLIEKKLQQK